MASVLGNGDAAGIQAADAAMDFIQLHMGVTEEEHRACGQRGEIVRVCVMTVGQVEGIPIQQQLGKLRKAGEGKHHLVNLCLAVAPDGDDFVLEGRQHGNDLFRGVVPGKVVPGAMVEQVAQQDNSVRLLLLNQIQQLFAPEGGAVDIGRNYKFHRLPPKTAGQCPAQCIKKFKDMLSLRTSAGTLVWPLPGIPSGHNPFPFPSHGRGRWMRSLPENVQ